MRLIGLHARMQGGKDTTFEIIDQYSIDKGLLALRRAFADPLKISGMRALGFHEDWPDEALVDIANQIKENGKIVVTYDGVSDSGNIVPRAKVISGRQLWQYYGTEAHRADDLGASFGPSFWVDNLLPEGGEERPRFWNNFKESWAGFADYAIVTDVRFPNEAQRILDLGGEVWWIDADGRLGPNESDHPSERKLDDQFITRSIDNNGTIEELIEEVESALDD